MIGMSADCWTRLYLMCKSSGAVLHLERREKQMSSGPHRGATAPPRLLQVMVVGQDLHQEVQLQRLRLKDSEWFSNYTFQWNFRVSKECERILDLGPLVLDAPDAAGAVHHRVLWHDLARVDLATGPNDAAAGEDHVPAQISWEEKDAKHWD